MTKLSDTLSRKKRLLTTEFLPPNSPRLSGLVEKVLSVGDVVDAVSIPELKANPRSPSPFRMSAFYAAYRVKTLTGVEAVFHLTPRDLNRNAIGGLLLAANDAGLQNILVIGGDKYRADSQESSRNVYDFAGATELIQGIRKLENDYPDAARSTCIIAGTDPTVIYSGNKTRIEAEVMKLITRQDVGADLAQTQPIFDLEYFEFLDIAKEHGLKIPILVGILPLRGKDDSAEIERRYGILVPKGVTETLGDDARAGKRFALDLAQQLLREGVNALHVYPREDCEFLRNLADVCFNFH